MGSAEIQGERPIAESAYEKVRRGIVLGEYRPNQRLVETELATDLNMSRTPVREALQRLESDGLIVRTRHGWVVYDHKPSEIREIYEIRAALESHAARLATERLRHGDRQRFRDLSEAGLQHTGLSVRQLADSNEQFHRLVFETAGNERLGELSERTTQYYFNYHLAATYSKEDLSKSREQHIAISDAILNGNADLAAELVRDHVRTALEVGLRKLGYDVAPIGVDHR